MSSLKRKRNLLDDKQKREIISYAKENSKLTQQIANNLTIKWDLFILISLYKCKMYVSRVETILESLSFHLITWLPVFNVPQFIAKLVIPPNYRLHRRWQFNEGTLYTVAPSPLIKPTLLLWKSGLIREMALLKGVNLVEFYCLSASEIWNEKRVTFDWRDLIRGRVL